MNSTEQPAVAGSVEPSVRPLTDSERLDFLQYLTTRTEFQNQRRPAEAVHSDLHIGGGRCSLYVRNLFGHPIKSGMGTDHDVRSLIDAVANELRPNT